MLWLFYTVTDFLKVSRFCIDNWAFQLHYRFTTSILMVCTILVCARQFFGEHIKCISDLAKRGFGGPVETFCFFSSTFTVNKYHDNFVPGQIAHPGVGPFGIDSPDDIKRHHYYQWVPFALFAQSMMFYLTRLLWKHLEGGRVRILVEGLEKASFSFLDKDIDVGNDTIVCRNKKQECMNKLRHAFINRIILNRSWSKFMFFCEILNCLNVGLQFYITDLFLGKDFSKLGPNVLSEGQKTLDRVFPKMTKCTFYKYGSSGTIEVHDALCVMALNIINEKIYTFLWFWFIFLFCISLSAIFWRIITMVLHSRSRRFNQMIFSKFVPKNLRHWNISLVMDYCTFSDWLFLKYLSKNMDGLIFKELFLGLAEDLEERKPLILDLNEKIGWKFHKPESESKLE